MRRPLIAGNWKMHTTIAEAVALAKAVVAAPSVPDEIDVVVCPPFTALWAVSHAVVGSRVGLGAQDAHWESAGAYTGEVSVEMLRDAGCRYVIVGHSERRQYFGETDEMVGRKTVAALAGGLTPIVCVGETLPEREAGMAAAVVAAQLKGALSEVIPDRARSVVIAYEPVWAIGTGHTATPAEAEEMHAHVRTLIAERFGAGIADGLRILYGGSVKPDNAEALLRRVEIDGALVGGASLQAAAFTAIARAARVGVRSP
jgi:triosephosphate isomerase